MKSLKLKSKLLIILAIMTVTFLIIGVVTLLTVRSKVIITAQEKLQGDLAMAREYVNEKFPGNWSVRDGKLFKGEVQMNDNFLFVDKIGELTGDNGAFYLQVHQYR
jgi:methyl-accepting chemotaxis protein